MKKVMIALLQMPVVDELEQNLESAKAYAKAAAEKGAELVVLPEMFCCTFKGRLFERYKEKEGGRIWQTLRQIALDNHIYLVGGSLPEDAGDKIYNTSFVFSPAGEQIGKHRKMHLFDVNVEGGISCKESDTLAAGNQLTLVDTEFGRIGVMICFDIRFTELCHLMALEGAKMVIVPAVFNTTTGPRHWELLFRSRALDSQIFMAGCSSARVERASYVAYGYSMITSPWGEVVNSLGTEAGILMQEIDLESVQQVRQQLPVLSARREDVYTLKIN